MSVSLFSRNTALVIIDVQQAMDAWPDRNNPALEANLQRILERWRKLGRPVYHVADDSPNPDSPYHPGRPTNAFKPEVAPVKGEAVIRKTGGNAFAGTDFETRLRQAGRDTLVVGGFMTNMCVESSVRGAADLGFSVYVLADATAAVARTDRRGRRWEAEDIHELALADMQGERTHIVTVEEALRAAESDELA